MEMPRLSHGSSFNKQLKHEHAYVNGVKMSLADYEERGHMSSDSIKDKHGNKMTFVERCIGRKCHFRLLGTTKMGEWHENWQETFKIEGKCEIEVTFPKIKDMIGSRRADVVLNETFLVEIQNSPIKSKEVSERKLDYEKNNKKVIWLINGNDGIKRTKLSYNGRTFFEFTQRWKYMSFLGYDIIYIDIKDRIYPLDPNQVKSDMIDVQKSLSKERFLKKLKACTPPQIKLDITQTTIYMKQQGAGNGKTYGIVQLLEDKKFNHYETLIYITKQHSAVNVIRTEMKNQYDVGYLPNTTFLSSEEDILEIKRKKYIETFKTKGCKTERRLIIATVDSFVYASNNSDKGEHSTIDKFVSMTVDIINGEYNRSLSFAGATLKLNKKILLICDEAQDLHSNYMKAVIKLSRETYIDLYFVGDILQSISYEDNSFTEFNKIDFSDCKWIKIVKYTPVNKCRRFNNPKIINFVNQMVSFDKYKLPKIDIKNAVEDDSGGLELFVLKGRDIKDNKGLVKDTHTIMDHYKQEVEINSLGPKDFLIVIPFTTIRSYTRTLAVTLKTRIDEYWGYNASEVHYSETGTSINLATSESKTRMVSIHSSKGDGREVVFVIGVTDTGLKCLTEGRQNLIYDSLIHVAFTRAKRKLYVSIQTLENGTVNEPLGKKIIAAARDGKISSSVNIDISWNHPVSVSGLNSLSEKYEYRDYYDPYRNMIESRPKHILPEINENHHIIDARHHLFRSSLFHINFIICILKDNNSRHIDDKVYDIKRYIRDVYKVIDTNNECEKICDYMKKLRKIQNDEHKNKFGKSALPLPIYCPLHYSTTNDTLREGIENIKRILSLKEHLSCIELCDMPIAHKLILLHLIGLYNKGCWTALHISQVHDILRCLDNKPGDNCLDVYLNDHYAKIETAQEMYNYVKIDRTSCKCIPEECVCNTVHKNLVWGIYHNSHYDGKNADFRIISTYDFTAYNDNTTILVNFAPQIRLNYDRVVAESITNEFIATHCKKKYMETADDEMYLYKITKGRSVSTYILSTDVEIPVKFSWGNELIKNNTDAIKSVLKSQLLEYYKKTIENSHFNFTQSAKATKGFLQKFDNLITTYREKFIPSYIIDTYSKISSEIKYAKGNARKQIINKYREEKEFMELAGRILEQSVETYLEIYDEESDEESDEEY